MSSDQILSPEALHRALEGSISQDKQLRRQSEDYLFKITTARGAIPLLLTLISTEQVDSAVRLAGAIKLKNLVLTQWREDDILSPEDRTSLWSNLYNIVIGVGHTNEAVRRQFFEILRHIVFNADKKDVADLLSRVKVDLEQRSNGDTLLCALKILRKLLYRYEYHAKSLTEEVNALVDELFGQLLKIAQDASTAGLESPDAATCIHHVLKIYFSMGLLTTPTTRTVENTLQSWMALCQFVLENPVPWSKLFVPGESVLVPYAEFPDREETRINELPQFKCFKWALQVLTRLISCQSVRRSDKDEGKKHFGKFIKDGYAVEFAKRLIILMQMEATGNVVLTNTLHYKIWTYLKYSLSFPEVYNPAVKPCAQVIVQMLLQTFALNIYDQQEYSEDPEFYIQNCPDISFQLASPRGSAADFIKDACKIRPSTFVPMVIVAAKEIFENPNKTPQDVYGFMCLIGHPVASVLQNSKKTAKKKNADGVVIPEEQLLDGEAFINAYVLPMLSSGDMWLRMRSAWLCGRVMLTVTSWKSESTPLNMYSRLVEMINDKELMVSVMATGAVLGFLNSSNETLKKAIIEFIPHLLQSLFKLMERIELETVVATLDEIVSKYSVAALPFGAQITENVCNALWNSISSDISKNNSENDVDSDEQVLARWSMLQTLTSIVKLASDVDPKNMQQSDCDMFVKITQNSTGLLTLLYENLDQDRLMDYLDDLALILGYLAKIVHKVVAFLGEDKAAAMGARFADLWRILRLSMKTISVYHELDKESDGGISAVMVELSVLRDPVRSLLAHAPSGFTYDVALQLYTLCQQANNVEDHQHAERLLADMFEVCINNRACDQILQPAAKALIRTVEKDIDVIAEAPAYYRARIRYVAILLIYACGENPPFKSMGAPNVLIDLLLRLSPEEVSKHMRKVMLICFGRLMQVGIRTSGFESISQAIDEILLHESEQQAEGQEENADLDFYEDVDDEDIDSLDYDYDSDFDDDDDDDDDEYDSDYDDSYGEEFNDGCSPLGAEAYEKMKQSFLKG